MSSNNEIAKILAMTDKEVMESAIKEFGSLKAAIKQAERMRANILKLIDQLKTNSKETQCHLR